MTPRTRARAGASILTVSLLAVAPLAITGAAWSAGAASIADVQAQLAGCTGTTDSPTTITLTADISAPSAELEVPCVAVLDEAGHALSISDVVVDPTWAFTITSSAGNSTSHGPSITMHPSTRPEFTVTDASLVVQQTAIGDRGPTPESFSASGGTVSFQDGGRFLGDGRIDLGTDGTLEAGPGSAVTTLTPDGSPGIVGGTGARVLADGGSIAAVGNGTSSSSEEATGIALGDGGTVRLSGTGDIGAGGISVGEDGVIDLQGGAHRPELSPTTVGRSGLSVGARGRITLAPSVDFEMYAVGDDAPGIHLPPSAELDVTGGTVVAIGSAGGAAVGGASGEGGGTVDVTGGLLYAMTTSGSGAAVGGGAGGAGGDITVAGASLTAQTGTFAGAGSALGAGSTTGAPSPAFGHVTLHDASLTLPAGPLVIPDSDPSGSEVTLDAGSVIAGSVLAEGDDATVSGTGQIDDGGAITLPTDHLTGATILDRDHLVSFDTDGGSSGPPPVTVYADTFTAGDRAFPDDPTRAGYTFEGWNTVPDGTGTAISATSPLPGSSADGEPVPTTAYAVWRAPQSVAFTSTPPSTTTVGEQYTPTATGSGTQAPVTISIASDSAGVCSIRDGIVMFRHVGTCVVQADQAGDSTHDAAPQVTQSIAVGAASQSVVFTSEAPDNAQVGDTYRPLVSGGGSSSPIVIGLTPGSAGVCTLSDSVVQLLAAGTCTITADQAGDADHDAATEVTQDVLVGRAATTTAVQVLPRQIRATVSSATGDIPGGEVDFDVDGVDIGTVTLGPEGTASFPYTVPSGATRTVSATYRGDSDHSGSRAEVDRRDPSIRATLTSAKPESSSGWYRTPVAIHFECHAGSAAYTSSCPAGLVLSASGRDLVVTRTVSTADGGSATVTVSGIDLDRTAPTVHVAGASTGATYHHIRRLRCLVLDALSGPGRCVITTVRVGNVVRYRAVGRDVAGNVATSNGRYRIKKK